MAKSPSKQDITSVGDNSTNVDRQATPVEAMAFRVRAFAVAAKVTYTQVQKTLGIPPSSLANYWSGKRPWPVDAMPALADLLGRSIDEIVRNKSTFVGRSLFPVDEADWIDVEEFDLREMTDHGKGAPIGRAVFRRDWLYLSLGESNGLWITKTLTPDPQKGLPAGSAIVCKDVVEGELPLEGQHYVFYVNRGVLLARFSYRGLASASPGETVVTPADLDPDAGLGQHFIVARVLGALARPFV